MPPQTAPIRRRKLGIRLHELRKQAGLSQDEVATWTGLSQPTISKIEGARQAIEVRHVRLLALCYGVDSPEIDQLIRMASEADDRGLLVAHSDTVPDFARDYVELEGYASELWVHEPGWVFGLLQIPEYVRAVRLAVHPEATEEELARSVALRAARQERVMGDQPPKLRVLLDEAVLHRAIGGQEVMAAQLRHLEAVSRLPHIDLQVIPFAFGAHPAVGSGFTVLRFEDSSPGMDVVYVENRRSATYHEKPSDLAHYMDLFDLISRTALDPEATRSLLTTLARDLWEQSKRG